MIIIAESQTVLQLSDPVEEMDVDDNGLCGWDCYNETCNGTCGLWCC